MTKQTNNLKRIASLADHLSYKSSIILIPPAHLIGPIDSIRRGRDKHFQRWPAHINLLYPFLKEPSQKPARRDANGKVRPGPLKQDIASRVTRAVKDLRPFELKVRRTGIFQHSTQASTLWLRPECGEKEWCFEESGQIGDDNETTRWQSANLARLQQNLQEEFGECDADPRAFAPHMSVANADTASAAKAMEKDVNKLLFEWCGGEGAQHGGRIRQNGEWEIDWRVESIMVVERFGYNGRFNVVSEFPLGADSSVREDKAAEPVVSERRAEWLDAIKSRGVSKAPSVS